MSITGSEAAPQSRARLEELMRRCSPGRSPGAVFSAASVSVPVTAQMMSAAVGELSMAVRRSLTMRGLKEVEGSRSAMTVGARKGSPR